MRERTHYYDNVRNFATQTMCLMYLLLFSLLLLVLHVANVVAVAGHSNTARFVC
jgi:hypothetical protein